MRKRAVTVDIGMTLRRRVDHCTQHCGCEVFADLDEVLACVSLGMEGLYHLFGRFLRSKWMKLRIWQRDGVKSPQITFWAEINRVGDGMNTSEMLRVRLKALIFDWPRRVVWRLVPAPRGLDAEYAAELERNLTRLMEEQQLYLEPDLTAREVAARLGVAPRFVSYVISVRLGENFSGFVNRKRAEAAARALHTTERAHINRIMLQCGFGSKTAFQREFKRCIGVTPTEYRRAFLESQAQG